MKHTCEIDIKVIGQRIRKERNILGLSRDDFAELVGLSGYYVGQLERGDRQMSLTTAVKIAATLHISLDYLITGKHCVTEYTGIQEDYVFEDKDNLYNAKEIHDLLIRCSHKELELIEKLIKTILPYNLGD